MTKSVRIILFSLFVIIGYALFSRYSVPRIEPEPPPPLEAQRSLDEMSGPEIVALGKWIYNVKGSCTRCHGGAVARGAHSRAPGLDKVATRAEKRINEPAYKGLASSGAAYIYESMISPSAYVVRGYGVPGTNDTESPMPTSTSRAIGLSEAEARAVVLYLFDLEGVELKANFILPSPPLPDPLIPNQALPKPALNEGGKE